MCTIYICPSPNTPSPTRAPRETGVAHVARGAAGCGLSALCRLRDMCLYSDERVWCPCYKLDRS